MSHSSTDKKCLWELLDPRNHIKYFIGRNFSIPYLSHTGSSTFNAKKMGIESKHMNHILSFLSKSTIPMIHIVIFRSLGT